MIPAVSTRIFPEVRADRAIERIAERGILAVELAADGCHLDPRLGPDVPRVAAALRREGVEAASLHLPYLGLDLGHPERCDERRVGLVMRAALESAAALGARVAVLHPCSFFDEVRDRGAALDAVRRVVERAVLDAARLGVRVALEGLVSYGVWRVGTSLAELAALFPDPRVAFCLDTGHAGIERLDLASELAAAGERLALVHLDDNDGSHDGHLAPGEGVLDLAFTAPPAARVVHELAERRDAAAALDRIAGAAPARRHIALAWR